MLVLFRRVNEAVVVTVGDIQIRLTVLGFQKARKAVQLGFEAPREVTIHREEIQYRVDEAKQPKGEGSNESCI